MARVIPPRRRCRFLACKLAILVGWMWDRLVCLQYSSNFIVAAGPKSSRILSYGFLPFFLVFRCREDLGVEATTCRLQCTRNQSDLSLLFVRYQSSRLPNMMLPQATKTNYNSSLHPVPCEHVRVAPWCDYSQSLGRQHRPCSFRQFGVVQHRFDMP